MHRLLHLFGICRCNRFRAPGPKTSPEAQYGTLGATGLSRYGYGE